MRRELAEPEVDVALGPLEENPPRKPMSVATDEMNAPPQAVHLIVTNRLEQYVPPIVTSSQLSHLSSFDRRQGWIEVFRLGHTGIVRRTRGHVGYSNAAPIGTPAHGSENSPHCPRGPESIPKIGAVGRQHGGVYSEVPTGVHSLPDER